MNTKRILFLVFASVLLMASYSEAATIGTITLTDCGSNTPGCPAGSYTFNLTFAVHGLFWDFSGDSGR